MQLVGFFEEVLTNAISHMIEYEPSTNPFLCDVNKDTDNVSGYDETTDEPLDLSKILKCAVRGGKKNPYSVDHDMRTVSQVTVESSPASKVM